MGQRAGGHAGDSNGTAAGASSGALVPLRTNFLTLHREEDRHEYFVAHSKRDPNFDTGIQAWVVTEPSQCKELIASSKLRPATYTADYHALQTRLGIDFSCLIFAFDHIPLCQHGDAHIRIRRRISEFLAGRKAEVQARIPDAVCEHLAGLGREGPIEVMDGCIAPLVSDMMAVISGVDSSVMSECHIPSAMFDRFIGVAKRRKITDAISVLHQHISSLGENLSNEEVGVRLALLILGRDPLAGTLGESLYRLLKQHSGQRLSEISYPDVPVETGVPWVERQVITPFHLGGRDFVVGDRVRIYLQTLAYSDQAKAQTGFFGAGAHVCLGRPLSLELWKAVIACLSRITLRAKVVSYSARTSDYIFTCPVKLEVAMSR